MKTLFFSFATINLIIFFWIGSIVLKIVANWRLFTKAGVPGWKSIIPWYCDYVFFGLVWDIKYFWYYLASTVTLSIVNAIATNMEESLSAFFVSVLSLALCVPVLIIRWYLSQNSAKAYGKGTGFGVGLFFLPQIFRLIMGLDNSEYIGK